MPRRLPNGHSTSEFLDWEPGKEKEKDNEETQDELTETLA